MIGRYCILPGGNSDEFLELDSELINRKISAQYSNLIGNGRLYYIPEQDLDKLPFDEKGPYLGNDNSGHSIYLMDLDGSSKHLGPFNWIYIK